MLDIYNLSDLFFFFYSDHNIWHCFLNFVVISFGAEFFVLDKCFNCSVSLSKRDIACTVIKLAHNIADPEAVGEYNKIIFSDSGTILLSFFYSFWF